VEGCFLFTTGSGRVWWKRARSPAVHGIPASGGAQAPGVELKFCPECFADFADEAATCPTDGAVLVGADLDALIGTRIAGRYEVLSVIGKGGMGVVYKARHEHLDRMVAVKMLHAHLVSEPEAIKRFHREAKAVSRVKHPHTVTLYDFGVSDAGQPYIVMDYIEGVSLKKILKDTGPLGLERARHIFLQVIDALSCAHGEGVIHRDLKPENIMLSVKGDEHDWVEVVDFGISKLKGKDNQTVDQITRIGDVCGSPPYMSPEQCIATVPIDARSDIYALAVVLYESLSGRLPFKAKSAVEMIDCHLYSNPTPLKAASADLACCEGLNAVIAKALSKEPDRRQSNMVEFGQEMKEAVRRDSIKLSSYRHLSEALALEAQVTGAIGGEGDAAAPGDPRTSLREQAVTTRLARPQAGGEGGLFSRLVGAVLRLFGRGGKGGGEGREYVLTNCPYCNSEVQPNIRFCLDCGRNLPSPQELTKLRAAQGVFHYPRSHKSATDAPEFSNRARKVTSGAGSRMARVVILLNLILILLICLVYFGRVDDGKNAPATGGERTERAGARGAGNR